MLAIGLSTPRAFASDIASRAAAQGSFSFTALVAISTIGTERASRGTYRGVFAS